MAERQGFEPWRQLPAYTRSRRAPSTTRPPLQQTESYSVFPRAFKWSAERIDEPSKVARLKSGRASKRVWTPRISRPSLREALFGRVFPHGESSAWNSRKVSVEFR